MDPGLCKLAAAALFIIEAVSSVAVSFLFINHDNVLRALHAQGTQIPRAPASTPS